MRLPQSSTEAILSAILLPTLVIASGSYDCDNIVIKGHQWRLKELGGPKSALQSEPLASGSGFTNTTYTIDICKPLKKENKEIKCPNYTRVCAVQRDVASDGSADLLLDSWPLAGDLKDFGGKNLDAKWEILSESNSNADAAKEGLRLSMNGGTHKVHDQERPQRVIVEFICDKNRTGKENLWVPEDKYSNGKRAEGDESEEPQEDGNGDDKIPSLKFLRYNTTLADPDTDILRLEWRSKYACLDAAEVEPQPKNNSWGFFTWFILIAFLSTATYLIFGSWLNYNRYGARGWDLLPHGDTIRDAPYLLKDWMRRVLNTIQGGGSRGGYAAV